MAGERKSVFQDAEDGKKLISAVSHFALELYRQQGKRTGGNMFMSPLSVSAVLSMALLGSRNKTLAQMKSALFFEGLEDSKLHQAFGDIVLSLKKGRHLFDDVEEEKLYEMYMANRLYEEKTFVPREEYLTACRKYYDAELEAVDFVNASTKVAELINSWVAETTNQKIKHVISPDSVNSTTRLVLVNAIYFKSAWKKAFDEDHTKEEDFFVSPDETVRVQMMFQKLERAKYHYSSDLQCQVLKLPYECEALSMLLLLPDKASSSLKHLEKNLTADVLAGIDGKLSSSEEVNLWMPKLKIEEKMELKEILCDMGMVDLFSQGVADLSGIDDSKTLFASGVIHKAFVDVNEKGTEAAAATVMVMRMCSANLLQKPPPVDLRLDRPFVFIIREESTKAVLFIGRVVKPPEKS